MSTLKLSSYNYLTIVTVVVTLTLITIGSIVRTTESGLGCPDWPLCYGQVLPPAEKTAIIEWSHRTFAALTGLLIIGQAVITCLFRRKDGVLVKLSILTIPLLLIQAELGRRTVESELPPELVAFHLFTALVLVAVLSIITTYAWLGTNRIRTFTVQRSRVVRAAWICAFSVAGVMAIGTYAVATDAGFACTTWPDCKESMTPFVTGGRLQSIHWIHRFSVLIPFFTLGYLHMTISRLPSPDMRLRILAIFAASLFVVQIFVGALNVWTEWDEWARVLHLVFSASVWALLCATGVLALYENREITISK